MVRFSWNSQVLLFNFFEDSSAELSQWRVVLNALDEHERNCPAPVFDKARHAGICLEVSRVDSRLIVV